MVSKDFRPDHPPSLVTAWRTLVAEQPEAPSLIYGDSTFSAAAVDEMSDALAVALEVRGVGAGSRVGVHLQNVPHAVLTCLAVWKLGGTVLPLNPMYRGRDLTAILTSAEPVGIITTAPDISVVRAASDAATVRWVLSVDEATLQTGDHLAAYDRSDFPGTDADDVVALIEHYRGERPRPTSNVADGEAIAYLTYTSGTTGPPKGAMNTHANVLAVTSSFASFAGIDTGDVVYGLAPFFHITGAVLGVCLMVTRPVALVCTGRFEAEAALTAMRDHRATFAVGSITAYNAMMRSPIATRDHFASIKTVFSGGAPVPPSVVAEFEQRFGHYILNAYGMTETTSGVIAVPPGERAPVEPATSTLSIGRPLPGVEACVVDPADRILPAGVQGELVLRGPQIVPGYWRAPEATSAAMPGGRLHTGDGAVIDDDGWVYLVDRLKDQINVSGYKVWPREVEDSLYDHPGVFEAAVVGMPDDYQGESVIAYVALKPGARTDPGDLIDFVGDRLAAYKRPRHVHVLTELPKTQTGKIRRNVLRDQPPSAEAEEPAPGHGPAGSHHRKHSP